MSKPATQAATAAAYADCVPLNAFGPTAVTSDAYYYFINDTHSNVYNTLDDIGGTVTGALFDTWAGPVNFAISTRGDKPGIDHLGIQTDDDAELAALKARAEAADLALLDEGETTCCYARSEKHWVTDPQGIAWEHFHTLGNIPVFNEKEAATPASADAPACCTPRAPQGKPVGIPVKSSCC